MDLENIMLNEISQTEKNKYCLLSLICVVVKKKNLVGTESKLVVGRGRGWGVGEMGEGGQKIKRKKNRKMLLNFQLH